MRRGLLLDEFDTIRDGRLGIFSLLRCFSFELGLTFRVVSGVVSFGGERAAGEWTEEW